jgi:hypothetical protein
MKLDVYVGAAVYQMASGTEVVSKAGVDQWRVPVADIIIDVCPTGNKKVDDRNYRNPNVSSDGKRNGRSRETDSGGEDRRTRWETIACHPTR